MKISIAGLDVVMWVNATRVHFSKFHLINVYLFRLLVDPQNLH